MASTSLARYDCWIDGSYKGEERTYPLIDPATEDPYALATAAGPRLIHEAVAAAARAGGPWRSTTAFERAEILHTLAGSLRKEEDFLARLLSKETGKPLPAARDEVLHGALLIDYFAEESLRLAGEIPLLGHPRERVLITREPIGVVGAITPFNYPVSTLACKMGPALAVGCTLVAKPDEHTPLTTLKIAELACQAGLPPGVLNVVTGPGHVTGRLLVEHPVPRLITFTGSTEVGKEIQEISARFVRKVVLELGGHCPAFVCRDAAWKGLIPQIVQQSLKNSGQYCYRISRIYVAREIFKEFLAEFVHFASALRMGPPEEVGVNLGPLSNAEVLSMVRQYVHEAVEGGARLVWGGETAPVPERGFFYPVTVLTDVKADMPNASEEVFGPVVVIHSMEDIMEAIHETNAMPYGLAAYIFTESAGDALSWAEQIECGSVWINRIHQAYLEAPFGGMKESGLGREKSRFGLEEFTELKTIYLSY